MNVPINKILIDRYFSGKALTDEELTFARKSVEFNNFKVTKEEKIEKQANGNIVLAFVFCCFALHEPHNERFNDHDCSN